MPGNISLKVSASESRQLNSIAPARWGASFSQSFGVGAADVVYLDERTVDADTTDTIDLADSLTTALGRDFVAGDLYAIAVVNRPLDGDPNTTSLTIEPAAANGFSGALDGSITVPPGGMFMLAGDDLGAVVAGTGDLIDIVNPAGGSNTYLIAIFASDGD